MVYDYSPFWFMVLMVVGLFFIGLSVGFAWQMVFGMTPIPDTYKECITSDLPPYICEILYPPLNRQGA